MLLRFHPKSFKSLVPFSTAKKYHEEALGEPRAVRQGELGRLGARSQEFLVTHVSEPE